MTNNATRKISSMNTILIKQSRSQFLLNELKTRFRLNPVIAPAFISFPIHPLYQLTAADSGGQTVSRLSRRQEYPSCTLDIPARRIIFHVNYKKSMKEQLPYFGNQFKQWFIENIDLLLPDSDYLIIAELFNNSIHIFL